MILQLPQGSSMRHRDFVFGVATASFQIEGARAQRLPCIWDTFCQVQGNIADGTNGDVACDHVNLWQSDIELIANLGVDAYRLSISWPRVINVDGSVNTEGMQFYLQILDALNAKNIKVFVTLYHWDLPQHLEDKGGWLNRNTAFKFQEYVEQVVETFGDRVYAYATLNEPFCSAYLGYEIGIHAPGKTGRKNGRQAAHHLLLAHGLAMQVLNQRSPKTLNGIVLNFTPGYALSDSSADKLATIAANDYHNYWYASPVLSGEYPPFIYQLPLDERPDVLPGDMEIIHQPMGFLGVNFYTRAVYQADKEQFFKEVSLSNVKRTDIGWEIYPQAFTDLLLELQQRYELPDIYITENGAAFDDCIEQGEVNDIKRIDYYQQHLLAIDKAMVQGVNVKGYFAWSLMDNFEWAEGYSKRFGIVYVDYATQQRTVKQSGQAFKRFIEESKS
ncbi:GH1 family beta-glucosidase [Thalassotalea marina]|nr:GH1 family beta-glucosidase [Thalassotalea marina]